MKNIILILLFVLFFSGFIKAQTVIEMMNPGDATVVLLEVNDVTKADVVVYKSDDKNEIESYDFMWKFKKWGFSNFSIYLAKDTADTALFDPDMGITIHPQGKIYFTNNKDERGIKTPGFHLEGVLLRTGTNNSNDGKKSKEKALNDAEEKYGNE